MGINSPEASLKNKFIIFTYKNDLMPRILQINCYTLLKISRHNKIFFILIHPIINLTGNSMSDSRIDIE